MKIVGIAILDENTTAFEGNIEILKVDRQHKTAYASWNIFDKSGSSLAGLSQNYFLGKGEFTEADILEAVLENIRKYRVDRTYIFTEVKLI